MSEGKREVYRSRGAKSLWGWGRTAPTSAEMVGLVDLEATKSAVAESERGAVARGLGRAYGDAAQNAGGVVIDATTSVGVTDFDASNGVVTAKAGTSLDQLMNWFVPQGWFVPVTPGTRSVTVGGAIAADIHGKNHHSAGSWCDHVESFRLLCGNGETLDVSKESHPDVFWATAGGMGLTGVILDATFKMKSIETSRLIVDTDRAANLDEIMSLMVEGDADYDYSVAWIDILAKGSRMGRSVLDRGRFATADELSSYQKRTATAFSSDLHIPMPPLPSGLLNKASIAAFNELWFRKAPKQRRDAIMTIGQFFHPLDMVADWNRMYGRRGFLQWQYVVDIEDTELVRQTIEALGAGGTPSFLAVLKMFGPGNQGHLSFPKGGWTLALDIPVGGPDLSKLLDRLDRNVADAGGRIYLAKDSRVDASLIPQMYPRLGEWKEVRDKLDPTGQITSDLGRRLGLV